MYIFLQSTFSLSTYQTYDTLKHLEMNFILLFLFFFFLMHHFQEGWGNPHSFPIANKNFTAGEFLHLALHLQMQLSVRWYNPWRFNWWCIANQTGSDRGGMNISQRIKTVQPERESIEFCLFALLVCSQCLQEYPAHSKKAGYWAKSFREILGDQWCQWLLYSNTL